MAFNSAPGRAEYTATAGQTAFPFTFKIYATSDVKVYQTLSGATPDDTNDILTEITDYTVSINGDAGGTVTLVVGAGVNDSITIKRDLPIERNIEYQESGDLLASTLNTDQDYQTYLIADKETDNSRFLRLQESAQNVSSEIPSPVPLNFFQWNAAGTAIINVATLVADGYVWTAGDVYTKAELNAGALNTIYYTETETDALLANKIDTSKETLYDPQTTTHNFTTDADYTLTTAQNMYGRIVLTDTGVVLTTARNVITDNVQKSFTVQNDTAQTLTIKTLAGTGISIPANGQENLYNDGTNIISLSQSGSVLQTVNLTTGTFASGTTLVPDDDTIPQITEGTQFMTLNITPKEATSLLEVDVVANLGSNTTNSMSAIAFVDTGPDAVAVGSDQVTSANTNVNIAFKFFIPATSTALKTISVRAGGHVAGTTIFNGRNGAARFGGTFASSITIKEIKQ